MRHAANVEVLSLLHFNDGGAATTSGQRESETVGVRAQTTKGHGLAGTSGLATTPMAANAAANKTDGPPSVLEADKTELQRGNVKFIMKRLGRMLGNIHKF